MRKTRFTGIALGIALSLFVVADGVAIAQEWNPFAEILKSKPQRSEESSRSGRDESGNHPPMSKIVLASQSTVGALASAIQKYQGLVAAGGWQPIPKGRSLSRNDTGDRVVWLKRRLLATGDLRDTSGQASAFDGNTEQAVMRFQERHGLTPSGKVNSRTFRAMNVSAAKRLEQLRINQFRIREIIQKTGNGRYVLVNIPAYELQAVSGNSVELFSRVIVGKPHTPTPNVQTSIRAVNYLPHWHVPQSIAVRALIPEIKKDLGYLERQHIRVYATWGGAEVRPTEVNWWSPQGQRYVFRQDPGPFNALGVVRLDMPNKHIVYMHDTPLKNLYKYYLRPYSAGCVRVQRVLDLANWLLSNDYPDWNSSTGNRIVQSGQPETIKLKKPVPVHFVYVTAWATTFGGIAFREDIYDKDGGGSQVARAEKWETGTRVITP